MKSGDRLVDKNANKAWKKIEGYLKECVLLGFIMVVLAHMVLYFNPVWPERWFHFVCKLLEENIPVSYNTLIAFVTFVFSYAIIVPIYFIRSINVFIGTGINIKKSLNNTQKICLSFATVSFCLLILIFPYWLLVKGYGDNNYRISVVYDAVTQTYIGLSIFSGVSNWLSVVVLLVLFGFLPLLWSRRQ